MTRRDRKRWDQERRADEAFYDGLLLGHYWRQQQTHAGKEHEGEPWYDGEDFEDDLAGDDLDMMDDWH